MSALSRFLSQQNALGRAALVAICLAAPAVHAEDGIQLKATVYSDEGPIVQTFSDAELKNRIVDVTKNVDRNLKAMGDFLSSLQTIGEKNISAEAKLLELRKVSQATVNILNEGRNFRYDFSNLQAMPQERTIRDIDLLTARSNRLNEFVKNMEMTLKEFDVALEQHNYAGIDKAYFKVARAYDEEQAIERQMRDSGFIPQEAANGL
ncbi:hypothetical protein [Rhizobium sp. MHM7A]|uniref:hypothetical protein n=1 Tax=Rhizobium sp. MHM7A TaxID=2583233 RepID=UPI001105C05D|nr:hypothetical protein [Rhizobium sp. MHM7A]TLX16909.1 hypothetical protein FFR93_06065 [Rhizobium sp. MHM7A]